MFDNDYDVFYPFVKDKTIKEGKTFREMLLDYAEDENFFIQIENALPLLTIYVPAMSEFGGFDALSWDADDPEIAVTPRNEEDTQVFYAAGEEAFSLTPEEIPGFPVLVVKTNEKLRLKGSMDRKLSAKAINKQSYEFVDEHFDRRIRQASFGTVVEKLNPTKLSARSSTSIVAEQNLIRSAWNEFGIDAKYWQRDHVYYGATKQPKDAAMNPHIYEHINSIELDKKLIHLIQQHPDNPRYREHTERNGRRNNVLSSADVNRALWTGGTFQIRIDIYFADRLKSTQDAEIIPFLLHPTDVFRFRKYSRHTSKPLFSKYKHVCSASLDDLESIVYLPENGRGIKLNRWDIYNKAMKMTFDFTLVNSVAVLKESTSQKTTFAQASNFSGTAGLDVTKIFRLGFSFGSSTTLTNEETRAFEKTINRGSMPLGNMSFYYSDPVVTSTPLVMQYECGPYTISGVYKLAMG